MRKTHDKCPILKTIAYFDIFDWPVRVEEVWKWLFSPSCSPRVDEILNKIKNDNFLKTVLEEKNGFYFLQGKKNLIKTRSVRYRFAERKYDRALRFVKVASLFPFIKMVAVCNNLGYSNAPNKSDIDLFVITTKKRIWITRFFLVGFLKIFKLRPGDKVRGKTKNDTICPSFFIDEGSLNLEKLTLKNDTGDIDDPHFVYWLNQMSPILDRDKTYEKFRQKNIWIKKFLPNIYNYETSKRRVIKNPQNYFLEFLLGGEFGDHLEKLAKKIQIKMMPQELKSKANINTNIVITDGILKFHKNDTREKIRNKFYNKLRNYENNEITKR